MKKLITLALLLVSSIALRAQMININNNVQGDVYVVAYAYAAGGCTATYIDYAAGMMPAYTSGFIDLTLNASWGLGSVPTGPYDIVYATVSRDPSCAGTWGWGTVVGSCWAGGVEQYDEVTVGDPGCGYNTHACLEITISGSLCSGFAAGDVVQVDFGPGGVNANIDVNP